MNTMDEVFSIEDLHSEPHTPASSDQDEGDDCEQVQSSELPRKLVRTNVAAKGPAARKRVEPCTPPLSDEEGEDFEGEVPDLRAYFAYFENFPELEQVKMCRSYATYLSSMNPKNRLRYSAKSAESWKKRK